MYTTREFWLYIAVALMIVAGLAAKDAFTNDAFAGQADPIGEDLAQVAMAQPAFHLPERIALLRTVDGRVTDIPMAEQRAWRKFASTIGAHDVEIQSISAAQVADGRSGPALWIGNMTTSLTKVALGRAADSADAILVYEVANGDDGAAIVAAYLLPGESDAAPSQLVGIVIDRTAVATAGNRVSSSAEVAGQIPPVAVQLGIQFAAVQADTR